MLAWLAMLLTIPQSAPVNLIAQAPEDTPAEIVIQQPVRPLPGALDNVPVFNSNSPELVAEPGILLSTFPPAGMSSPEAHLDFAFSGRFDVFAHHVYKALDFDAEVPELLDSLYVGVLMHNPSTEPVTVRVLSGASYLSQPDAPFIELPSFVPFSLLSPVFAGPGSRAMGDILQGKRQDIFSPVITVAPGESELLMNQPIPIRELDQPINGRSTLVKLESNGPVYLASLAQFSDLNENGEEIAPTLASWEQILREGNLAGPRDRAPSPLPLAEGETLIYGRVAGVSEGARWQTVLTDAALNDEAPNDDAPNDEAPNSEITNGELPTEGQSFQQLTIPAAGEAFSYGISLLVGGTMGTGQVQSAPMLARYPDTAYQAHGNYGVRYSLTLPLYNSTNSPQEVSVALQTAIKEDELSADGLRFFAEEAPQTFFRGPVQVRYRRDDGFPEIRNVHLVQKRGQQSDPLAAMTLAPQETRTVKVDLLYPADSTPPQVLTVETAAQAAAQETRAQ